MQKDIIVVAEIFNNKLQPITFELISCAEQLVELYTAEIKIIIINKDPGKYTNEILNHTGHELISVTTPSIEGHNSFATKKILAQIFKELNPIFICTGHTSVGCDFAPGLSVKLKCSCITNINKMIVKDGKPVFSRSVFGGKLNTLIKPESIITVLTIQPGAFKRCIRKSESNKITSKVFNEKPGKIINLGIIKSTSGTSDLKDARVIVSLGRGVEDPENISKVENFSNLLIDSSIACSRPLVDNGWMKYKHQVGITGASVSPEIYFALGISGSTQHIAGMNNSEFIISINSDPDAAIFNISDICIVENLMFFLELFEKCSSGID